MLTPAEEMGLSGLNLAARLRKAFYQIPDETLICLIQRIRQESTRRHLIYLRDGQLDTIRVLPLPLTVLPDQLAYLHAVSLTVQNALKRLPELYLQDPEVHELLRLLPEEEQWLQDCWGLSQRENNPVFARLDAVIDFTSPMWKNSLCFLEPNLSGIGGLHLAPTCEQILADVVLPVLEAQDGQLQLELGLFSAPLAGMQVRTISAARCQPVLGSRGKLCARSCAGVGNRSCCRICRCVALRRVAWTTRPKRVRRSTNP
jgi:hypothetical protein